jgi:sulfatase-modifying factor enzyme 1
MNRSSIFQFLLVFLATALLFSCNKSDNPKNAPVQNEPAPVAEAPEQTSPHVTYLKDPAEVAALLDKYPAGTKILIDAPFAPFVPEGFETYLLTEYTRCANGCERPDPLPEALSFDLLLGFSIPENFSVVTGSEHAWRILADIDLQASSIRPPGDYQSFRAMLAKRNRPDEPQFAPPNDPKLTPDEFGAMVQIPSKDGDFFIDKYETTHGQFVKFLNAFGLPPEQLGPYYSIHDPASKIVHIGGAYRVYWGAINLPVFNVSWLGAKAYCRWVDKDLPTRKQWLTAAGAGDGRAYPWGNQTDFTKRANFLGLEDGYNLWAPVDAFPEGKSPHGVYNLSGNIYEWLEDFQVAGGAWEFGPEVGKLSHQDNNYPTARNLHDGIRCVRKVP